MIARHIPMKSARRSSFSELVAYITHAKDKAVRIGEVRVTNCHQDNAADAVLEVLATQLQNRRACSDKTYHLLISFPAGEQPAAEVLRAIEDEVCNALGFGEHQRVSAVHTDTDNLHIHVAINKIHPKTLTIHNPYSDYKALGVVCKALELSHGLTPTNHETNERGARTRALDMEYSAGVESLLGWIRRECLEELRQIQSWGELHDALARAGLALQERGNGLIVSDREGRMVKASSIAREFSKAQLVKRFGPYEANDSQLQASRVQKAYKGVEKAYKARPVSRDSGTDELYQRYQAEQARKRAARTQIRQELREQKHHLVSRAKDRARIKRGLIRQLDCDRLMKRLLYHQAGSALREDLRSIHEQNEAQRRKSLADAKPLSWFDWLAERAALNDGAALAALRRRQCFALGRANALLGTQGRGQQSKADDWRGLHLGMRIDGMRIDSVTRQGTVIYADGKSAIRDSGCRVEVSEGIRQQGLEVALAMAVKRFGPSLTIEGDDAFRERVLRTTRALQLDIAFTDMADRTDRARRQESQTLADNPGERAEAPRVPGFPADVAGNAGCEAARRYIAEREMKRRQIASIPRHVLGKLSAREVQYAGWRRVDGQFLLLARTSPDEIAVIPVDAAVITHLSRAKRGEKINLNETTAAQLGGLPGGVSGRLKR